METLILLAINGHQHIWGIKFYQKKEFTESTYSTQGRQSTHCYKRNLLIKYASDIVFRLAVIFRKIKCRTYIKNYLSLWYKSRLPQSGQWTSADFEMMLRARLWIRTTETTQINETETEGFER